MRDDAIADEVVRAFYLDVVDVFFGDRFDGDDAFPCRVMIHLLPAGGLERDQVCHSASRGFDPLRRLQDIHRLI